MPAQPPAPLTGDELAMRRRVSDLEREEVADVLREAAAEGRLSYAELEERLETLFASKTYGELVEITADLPNGLAVPGVPAVSTQQYAGVTVQTGPVINAFMSETKRTGNWLAPQHQEVNAVLGDITLDYTEAQLPYDEVYVEVKSILADVKIRVPQNAIVHLDSNPILGSVSEQQSGPAGPSTPGKPTTFHIRGTAILGEIKIKRGPRLTKRLGLA
ncbi:cell wall-active antibiotic response 4TMS protein YvqF [Kribbella steppae]|uniref:Cell wall-active antibiotic response 4TMS protein YvqF n=1 Tax=Kribbella steppae TaxID=2512223 RepID=A0A4V2S0Y3_9ACTN|nr:cell wall-active antibiotic response 4TMS protein YvqF [Kribbella steppae]